MVDGIWPLLVVPLIAVVAIRTGSVTLGGGLLGALVAGKLAAGLGWGGVAMLATLLVLGTLVSRRGSRRRDPVQVFCDGGVAWIGGWLAWRGDAAGVVLAAGALSTALSDTLSGELGRRFSKAPRLLLLGPRRDAGFDGAMSWPGVLAGILGAAAVALTGWACGTLGPEVARSVVFAGLIGNLADSVLGWLWQPHLGPRGNDWTNLFATAIGGVAALLI
ncbi:MAG: DUF92 domain-containing protein [Planctomycetota bacterium]